MTDTAETPDVNTNISAAYRARFGRGPSPRAPEMYETDEITGTLRLRDEVAIDNAKPRGPANGAPESASSDCDADDVSVSELSEALTSLSETAAMIIERLDALTEMVAQQLTDEG